MGWASVYCRQDFSTKGQHERRLSWSLSAGQGGREARHGRHCDGYARGIGVDCYLIRYRYANLLGRMGGPVSEVQIERQELQASTDRCAKQANASAFRLFCMGKGKTSTVEEKSEFW